MKIVLSKEQWQRFVAPMIPEAIEMIKERKRQAKRQAALEEAAESKKDIAV